jgi:hypothetical protein
MLFLCAYAAITGSFASIRIVFSSTCSGLFGSDSVS